MLELGHILLQVDPMYSNALQAFLGLDLQVATHRQGLVILRYLVPLHQVGVRVVLAVELRVAGYAAMERQAGHDSVFHSFPVDNWQRTR
jgi:hypothetical protein